MVDKIIFVNIGIGQFRGGAENFDLHLAEQFFQHGSHVEFYYLRPLRSKDRFTLPSNYTAHPVRSPWLYPITMFFHSIPFLKHISLIRGLPRVLGQLWFEWLVYKQLKKRKKKGESFIVHVNALPYLANSLYRNIGIHAIIRRPGPLLSFIDSYFAKRSRKMIANGDAYRQLHKKFQQLSYINVGIDETFITPLEQSKEQLRKELGLDTSKQYLLFVGRLIPIKHPFFMLEVMKRLSHQSSTIDLLIVGEGRLEDEMKKYCKDYGIENRVHFLGYMNKASLKKYYSASDLFLICSRYDNYPNVVIESMGLGLPSVGADVGGIGLIIKHEQTGYCLPHDRDLFVEKIQTLLSDVHTLQAFSLNAREHIKENFSWKKTYEDYIALHNIT